MEPIAPEHTRWTPGVKPSIVGRTPDEAAGADGVELPDEVAVTNGVGVGDLVGVGDAVGLSAATQPKRAALVARAAVSISPVLSKDREDDRL